MQEAMQALLDQKRATHYYILMLSSDRFGLLEGDNDGVSYIEMPPDVTKLINETFPGLDGVQAALDNSSIDGHKSPYHMFRSRNDVAKMEAEMFFRQLDKVLAEKIFKDDPTPVILATLPEHQTMFRTLCTIPTLQPEGIEKDPESMTGDELRDDAVAILESQWEAQIGGIIDNFEYNKSKDRASDIPADIAVALYEREVGVLLVEEGKVIPGTYDVETGILNEDAPYPEGEDIIVAFMKAAQAQDATVYILTPEQMPTDSGVAAVYRY